MKQISRQSVTIVVEETELGKAESKDQFIPVESDSADGCEWRKFGDIDVPPGKVWGIVRRTTFIRDGLTVVVFEIIKEL